MTTTRGRGRLTGALSALSALGLGCAGPLAGQRSPARSIAPETQQSWMALVEGRDGEAASRFASVLARQPHDVLALAGDASLAFERGESERALASYATELESVTGQFSAAPAAVPDPLVSGLAAMAVGRVAVLLEEFGGSASARRRIEDRVLALPLTGLSWETRHELATLGDDIARRRGDVRLLAQVARTAGCVSRFRVMRPAGNLPHLDLDLNLPESTVAAEAGREGAGFQGSGCVVVIPAFDGRAGAQRIRARIDTPEDGEYEIVLDFRGEARLSVDGGVAVSHGDEHAYGPRVSAMRMKLSRGSHGIDLRLATFGGSPELSLMVVPVVQSWGPRPDPTPAAGLAADPLAMVRDFAETYVANRRGDAGRVWQGARRLEQSHRFALGLALAAALERDDPSTPANFTRDRARALLRAAVAVDSGLARPRHALSAIALDDERPREAIDEALAAIRAAPTWWLPDWTLYAAYRLRGLTWDADRALDRAIAHGPGACQLAEAALGRAEDRHDLAGEKRFEAALVTCGVDADQQIERLRRHGDLAGAEAALRRRVALAPDRDDDKTNLASLLLARGKGAEAAELLAATVQSADSEGQLRLADALIASGAADKAKLVVGGALFAHPEMPDIARAARALALPLPLDPFRLDGRKVIRDFEASGRRYAAPAVVILDRTVTRVFPSGAEMVLTHEIVRVQSKEALEKWGEISVPERTEILVLRTHKADGSTREPEEFAGKDTLSAADLAIGDYVEKETIETRPPRDAFLAAQPAAALAVSSSTPGAEPSAGRAPAGGFLGDRFYFQSFDAPLDRSEYLLVTTPDAADHMQVDRRAGAPEAKRSPAPAAIPLASGSAPTRVSAVPGQPAETLVVTSFVATGVPQLFAERSSVPAVEHVPSVRVSLRVGWPAWARFLREQLYGTIRRAPALDRAAAQIRAATAGGDPAARAAALVAWVGQNVEADDDLRDFASFGVTRGRGNRLAVILALARELGLDARPVLARSRLTAEGDAPAPLEEADDFADPLVRFELPGRQIFFVDPRLKHAPLGYLPPGLDGARVLVLDSAQFEVAHTRLQDHRSVDVAVRLDAEGGGVAEAVEAVRGWPALEWAEIVDRFGADSAKLRQDFEQRWLGVHFPGAVLNDLRIEILAAGGRPDLTKPVGAPSAVVPSLLGQATTVSAPSGPYVATEVSLRYTFSSARLAVKREHELRFLPTFFRSQPGRRYATEPRRSTALMTGFDVPLDLQARVELPRGGHLLRSHPASSVLPAAVAGGVPSSRPPPQPLTAEGNGALVAGPSGYRFFEERRLDADAVTPQVLVLRRQSRLPIMRVTLPEYPTLAAALRRVDALEQEEVRIGIAPERP